MEGGGGGCCTESCFEKGVLRVGRGANVCPKSEFRASAPLSLDMAPFSCMLGAAGGSRGA